MSTVQAAVTLITYRQKEVLILKRTPHELDPWSGHLSLPGGRIDPEDATPLAAALRETLEESAIDLSRISDFTTLDLERAGLSATHSLLVQPFHFDLQEKPKIELQIEEHCDYFWVDIDYLKNPLNHLLKKKSKDHPHQQFFSIDIEGNDLWGFTFKVIQDFIQQEKDVLK